MLMAGKWRQRHAAAAAGGNQPAWPSSARGVSSVGIGELARRGVAWREENEEMA